MPVKRKRLPAEGGDASRPAAAIFRQSQWMWPERHYHDIHNCYALFRRTFHLNKRPKCAMIYLTADQSYQLWVNGQLAARGPARGFQSHWPYDQLDIAALLKPGRNLLGIRAYNTGHSTMHYVSAGWAGVLVALRLGREGFVSDGSWRSIRQPGIRRDAVPVGIQMGFAQEHVDARIAPHGWLSPGFDDSSWLVPALRPWNTMPWYSLEERGLPQSFERPVRNATVVAAGEGRSTSGYETARDVARLFFEEGANFALGPQPVQPLEIPATGAGNYRCVLLDFGRTQVGNFSLTVHGGSGGEIVDLVFGETVDPISGRLEVAYPSNCQQAFASRLICRAGATQHTFYHAFGFRYAVVTVRDSDRRIRLEWTLHTTGYPLERRGSFQSSDPRLLKIWETCAWTQQVCSLDAFVDTPWREQAQWWGDARVQACNVIHLDGNVRLLRRGLRQIAEQTLPNGLTYGHAPTMAHECVLPDFTLMWILTLWDYYWQTGSLEAFATHQKTLEGALGYFRQQSGRNGLLGYDPRYWLFLDWTLLFKDGYSSVYNLWLLYALDRIAILYRLSGQRSAAADCSAWAASLRQALRKLVGSDGLMRDGRTWKGAVVSSASVHAQTLALMTRLHPVAERQMLQGKLLPCVRDELPLADQRLEREAIERSLTDPTQSRSAKVDARPNAYWITHVYTELAQRGHAREVISHIRKHWQAMTEHGTTWEHFEPKRGNESFSHAWSAHPLYHLMQIIGGVRQTSVAWSRVRIEPELIGFHGGCVIPTPRGSIETEWQRQGSHVKMRVALPRGVTAICVLPGQQPLKIRGRLSWTAQIPEDHDPGTGRASRGQTILK